MQRRDVFFTRRARSFAWHAEERSRGAHENVVRVDRPVNQASCVYRRDRPLEIVARGRPGSGRGTLEHCEARVERTDRLHMGAP